MDDIEERAALLSRADDLHDELTYLLTRYADLDIARGADARDVARFALDCLAAYKANLTVGKETAPKAS